MHPSRPWQKLQAWFSFFFTVSGQFWTRNIDLQNNAHDLLVFCCWWLAPFLLLPMRLLPCWVFKTRSSILKNLKKTEKKQKQTSKTETETLIKSTYKANAVYNNATKLPSMAGCLAVWLPQKQPKKQQTAIKSHRNLVAKSKHHWTMLSATKRAKLCIQNEVTTKAKRLKKHNHFWNIQVNKSNEQQKKSKQHHHHLSSNI